MDHNEYRIMFDLESTYWWFLGKQFLVKNKLNTLGFGGSKGERILDLGCGTGMILKVLEEYGVCCGAEISPEAISFLKKRQLDRIICTDVNGPLPFKDNSFSLITCLDVLEHLKRDRDLMMEMFRVCVPGGYVFVTVPAFSFFWSPHDTALHHQRRYVRKQMLDHIRSVKGKVIKASYYNMFLSLPIAVVRKLKALGLGTEEAKSDFFLSLPDALNKALRVIFKLEIFLLSFVNYPFGVSLLVIARKGEKGIGSGNL
jgi:ubiquinone/menaquinone biosynthesis C-methylase UbiE